MVIVRMLPDINGMTTHPKRTSLPERISALIAGSPDVEQQLSSYPAPIPECWIWQGNAAMLVHELGKAKRVVRTLIELACRESLPDAWVPARLPTCGSQRCVNPTHFTLKPHNQNRYGMEGPLPALLMRIDGRESDEIRELLEEWEHPSLGEFRERCAACHISFSEVAVAEVFSH